MNNKKIKNTLSDALNSAGKQESFLDNLSNNTRYQNVKSREGKRMVAAYFTADIHKSLKMLAVQNDTSIQDIVHEAISTYLKAKGY
jgi:UDP-glucose 4-epimerase